MTNANWGDERLPQRFWNKTIPEPNTGCWLWTGATDPCGYGAIGAGSKTDGSNRMWRAHRFAFLQLIGEIGQGLELDHVCRVRCCVNPAHLEAVTPQENKRRSELWRVWEAAREKTHCVRGHLLNGDNLYVYKGVRQCRACNCVRSKNYRKLRGVQFVISP